MLLLLLLNLAPVRFRERRQQEQEQQPLIPTSISLRVQSLSVLPAQKLKRSQQHPKAKRASLTSLIHKNILRIY